jgi:hypothetical protein
MGKIDFKEMLKINPHDLGYDCISHPSKAFEVGEMTVQARSEVARAEMFLDSTRSRVAKEIRQDPKAYGLKRGTDAEVKETLEGHDDVLSARRSLASAYSNLNLANVAYEQMKDKSIQLGRVKKLVEDGFFGEIRIRNAKQ